MGSIVEVTEQQPDPATPPLRLTVGRADNGGWNMHVQVGGLEPWRAAALLIDAAATILRDDRSGRTMGYCHLLDQLAAGLVLALDQAPGTPCPGCGDVHDPLEV